MNMALVTTAAEQALGLALPHRRMEDWRWTDLRQMIGDTDLPEPKRVDVILM